MNKLQVINDERFKIFSKENLGSVRTVLLNNEVWFCIKDVCDILELTNPTVVAKRLGIKIPAVDYAIHIKKKSFKG
ncbi:BRO family protein [Leptotrichia wadei]|jgi:toxin-antitoxin system, toxin component, bro family|uniref:BRO family protein n=1 Tax=Leptotrichia wadei TaxID=157687 RepID=UPI0026EA8EAA|nr:BRO family protein [Leptotrichia wadei]